MKVLLVQPPHYYEGGTRTPENFPLGLGYVARCLLDAGHNVEVLDIWAHQYTNQQVVETVRKVDCDLIGISALSTQYVYTKWLIGAFRRVTQSPIVMGNALATLTPEIALNAGADFCVIGEGEITFTELAEKLDSPEKVRGTCFKKDGRIVMTEPREYIKDLDSIPFPAWDAFPVKIYLSSCQVDGGRPALNVITSRGCPYSCGFCSKTFQGTRLRSIDNVIEEIKRLIARYHVKAIFFNDELVVMSKDRAYELCEKIEPLKIKWTCNGRVNLVDLPLLKRMRKAGCRVLGLGVESGSQTILDNMNKASTVEQAKTAIKNTLEAGIRPVIFMMFGYLGENRKTLAETVQFFRELPYLRADYVPFAITTPLPASALYDVCRRRGLIHSEEKYLEGLSAGFIDVRHRIRRSFVNLTEFSDEEVFKEKRKVEQQIVRDQIMAHLIEYVLNRISAYLSRDYLTRSIRHYGYWGTARGIGGRALSRLREFQNIV